MFGGGHNWAGGKQVMEKGVGRWRASPSNPLGPRASPAGSCDSSGLFSTNDCSDSFP